jgi:hypothetical protein
MKHDWTKKRRSRLFVYAIVLLFLPRSLDILFRNLYFMNLILMTNYTLSTEFVPAQVRGNNHWRTNQIQPQNTIQKVISIVFLRKRYPS